jgi:hypothetical protein
LPFLLDRFFREGSQVAFRRISFLATLGLGLLLAAQVPSMGQKFSQAPIAFVVPQDVDPVTFTLTSLDQTLTLTGQDILNGAEIHAKIVIGGFSYDVLGLNFSSSYQDPRDLYTLGPGDVDSQSRGSYLPWLKTAGQKLGSDKSSFALDWGGIGEPINDFIDPFPVLTHPGPVHQSFGLIFTTDNTFVGDSNFLGATFNTTITSSQRSTLASVPEPGIIALGVAAASSLGFVVVRRRKRAK